MSLSIPTTTTLTYEGLNTAGRAIDPNNPVVDVNFKSVTTANDDGRELSSTVVAWSYGNDLAGYEALSADLGDADLAAAIFKVKAWPVPTA